MPSEEFAADLGSALSWGRRTVLSLLPVFDVFHLKIRIPGCTAIAFCACTVIWLLSVVFCVARVVLKFGSRFVVNETPNKRRPVKWRESHSHWSYGSKNPWNRQYKQEEMEKKSDCNHLSCRQNNRKLLMCTSADSEEFQKVEQLQIRKKPSAHLRTKDSSKT